MINASWNVGATSNGLADSVGLMVYEGTQVLVELVDEGSSLRELRYWKNFVENFPKALQYVKNYAEGSSQWEGFPIKVPENSSLFGYIWLRLSLSYLFIFYYIFSHLFIYLFTGRWMCPKHRFCSAAKDPLGLSPSLLAFIMTRFINV